MKIGFIGLGNVGGKLAGSLIRNKLQNKLLKPLQSINGKPNNLTLLLYFGHCFSKVLPGFCLPLPWLMS